MITHLGLVLNKYLYNWDKRLIIGENPLYFMYFFSDAGNNDRVVIQELLKTVAQSQQLETSTQRDFKGL